MATLLTPRRRPVLLALLSLAALLAAAQAVDAQFRRGRSFTGSRGARPEDVDGRFQFCRVAHNGGWSVDSPRAEINLSIRLAELTKASVSFSGKDNPNYLTITLLDEALFSCPFIMMTEVGRGFLSDREAQQLRLYLLKGGFLWADDFWGEFEWEVWEDCARRSRPTSSRSSTCHRRIRSIRRSS